ncbi:MAG: Membrane protein mosC, partial [uncultured Rubrobacteraceae bacterium]
DRGARPRPPVRAARGARRLRAQRVRARGLVRQDTGGAGETGARGGAARCRAARDRRRCAGGDDGGRRPYLPVRQQARGRGLGGAARDLPAAAGHSTQPARPHRGARAGWRWQWRARRLHERPRRNRRGALRAQGNVLLPRRVQLRRPRRLRGRRPRR